MQPVVQIALLIMLTVTLVPILQYQAPADYAVRHNLTVLSPSRPVILKSSSDSYYLDCN